MQYSASASYEFLSGPPESVRLAFEAASHGKAASTAAKALRSAFPGRRPSSIVIVLELNRDEAEPET